MDIIAISFEHKCFSEARNKREYKSKIRAKLREWGSDESNLSDEEPEEESGVIPETSGGCEYNNSDHHYNTKPEHTNNKSAGGNAVGPIIPNGSNRLTNGVSQTPLAPVAPNQTLTGPLTAQYNKQIVEKPSQYQNFSPSSPISTHYGGFRNSPSIHPGHIPVSTNPPFIHLFDPTFLNTIDLNNPTVRAEWIQAVWDFFQSGGQWAAGGSPSSCNTPPGALSPPMNYFRSTSAPSDKCPGDEIMDYAPEVPAHGNLVIDPSISSPRTFSFVQEQEEDALRGVTALRYLE